MKLRFIDRPRGTPERSSSAGAGLLFLLSLPLSAPVLGAEWDQSASLSASTYVTDNFCLSRDDKEAEAVATVTPAANISGEGDRARVNLNARLEFNTLAQSDVECAGGGIGAQRGNRESVIPSGRFNADTDIIENTLFLEADAFAGLNPINPFGAGTSDALNGRRNTNIAYRWGAGVRYQDEYAQRVSSLLRYNYNEQINSVNQIFGDSTENRVDGQIGMIPGTSRLRLSASGRYSEVEVDGTAERASFTNTLASADLRLTFDLSQTWQLTAAYGEEFNEFLSVNDEIEGDYWDAGVRWSPNSRVVVDVGTGERFFGDTPRAAISYRHKRSSFSANYSKTLVFPRNIRAPGANQVDGGGLEFPNDPVDGFDNPVLIGNSPILNEAFTLQYSFNARRTRFSVNARESNQVRAIDGTTGEFRGATVAVSRNIGPKLSLNLRVGWRESEGSGVGAGLFGQSAETWTGDVSFSRRIARTTSLVLGYRYTDQSSEFELNEFDENRVSLTLQHNFR